MEVFEIYTPDLNRRGSLAFVLLLLLLLLLISSSRVKTSSLPRTTDSGFKSQLPQKGHTSVQLCYYRRYNYATMYDFLRKLCLCGDQIDPSR